ncbi:MAG TPA: AraC family transcriptional regulator [Planctomycetota bacterium]|nr:AraC family transcriptional regulator [Planctomycetota bacterium]
MADASRPLRARLTRILPDFVGDRDVAVRAYGQDEWMTPGMIERARGSDDWFILASPAGIDLGGGRSPSEALALWPPRHPHRYGDPARRWCHTWLHARGRLLDGELAGAGFAFGVAMTGIATAWLDRCVAALHDELAGHAQPDATILRNAVHTFLRQASRARHGATAAPRRLIDVRACIESSFAQRLTLADLARRADCSPTHLCVLYRRWFGASPIDHLIDVRLGHARRLLRDQRLAVAEVARLVGYDDARHFAKLFQRRVGCAPRRWAAGER